MGSFSKTIVVIESDNHIYDAIVEQLTPLNTKVQRATSNAEALELQKKIGGSIFWIVSDKYPLNPGTKPYTIGAEFIRDLVKKDKKITGNKVGFASNISVFDGVKDIPIFDKADFEISIAKIKALVVENMDI